MKITNHTAAEIEENRKSSMSPTPGHLLTILRPLFLKKSGRYFQTMNPDTVWYDENDNPYAAINVETGDLMTPDGKDPGFFFDLTPGIAEVKTEQAGNLFSEMYPWLGDN